MLRRSFIAFALGFAPVAWLFGQEPADATEKKFADSIAPFFAPFTTDRAALAPDGKHVAYTLHKGDTAYVIIMDVDRPDSTLTVAIAKDRARAKTADGTIKADTDEIDPDAGNFLA